MQIASPPAQLTPTQLRVRSLLLDWDPAGIGHLAGTCPVDEYDDLIDPILTALRHEPSHAELASDLHTVLSSDYGIAPSLAECARAAQELIILHGERSRSAFTFSLPQ